MEAKLTGRKRKNKWVEAQPARLKEQRALKRAAQRAALDAELGAAEQEAEAEREKEKLADLETRLRQLLVGSRSERNSEDSGTWAEVLIVLYLHVA